MGYALDIKAKDLKSVYRRLRIAGLTEVEAGNLVAALFGIAPTERGWKVEEIQKILFLNQLNLES